MARVDVNPTVLQWAATRSGKTDVIHEKIPNWHKWLNNEIQPTFKQLEKLAKYTATPLGYFFLEQPPVEQLPIPHFRTIRPTNTIDSPSPELLETVQIMERRQEWMREYLVDQGNTPLEFVGSKSINDNPHQVAMEIRRVLGLETGWAANVPTWREALRVLYQRIEDAGVLVAVNGIVGNNTHRKLDVNEFRGFVLIDEYAPLIFVNGADGKAAQMFTLAHELAHIWYGYSAAFDLQQLQPADAEIEIVCNKTAAEFLVPENELCEMWPGITQYPEKFQQLARSFKVSEIVAARRAFDLSLITPDKFFEFYNEYLERVASHNGSGGNFYSTQAFRIGRRFGEAIIRATQEGKLLYSEAYRLTGLTGSTFSEFAERLGLGGAV